MRVIVLLLAMTTAAGAQDAGVMAAMKRIGPAYMCGPPYEFGQALDALRAELLRLGVPQMLADFAADGVRREAETNKAKRETITADECATKYGRTR